MKSLPSHQGCGPDLLPAELLKASGTSGASAIADVCGRMHLEEKWPLQWQRGRQIDLFKGNSNVQDCERFMWFVAGRPHEQNTSDNFEK